MRGFLLSVMSVLTCCPAHPVVRVGVLAPNPLYGRSPRRWAGSVLALDSLWEEAKSRDPGEDGGTTAELGESAPGLLVRVNFQPGGVCRLGELIRCRAHQYVDKAILAISAYSLSPCSNQRNKVPF